MSFNYQKAPFFGVQYHPEFTPKVMAKIMTFLQDDLIKNKFYPGKELLHKDIQSLENQTVATDIINYKEHTREIAAWLKSLS